MQYTWKFFSQRELRAVQFEWTAARERLLDAAGRAVLSYKVHTRHRTCVRQPTRGGKIA